MLERKELLDDVTTLMEKIDYQRMEPAPQSDPVPATPTLTDIAHMFHVACEVLEWHPGAIDEAEIEMEVYGWDYRLNTYTVTMADCYILFDCHFNHFATMSFEITEQLADVANIINKQKGEHS